MLQASPVGVRGQNAIKIQENSVQFNTFFAVRYKRMVEELRVYLFICGFPEEKNSNRRKVFIRKFHKKIA